MHIGCAGALRERFGIVCGGAKHGDISGLRAEEIDDLVAYRESL